VTTTAPLTAPPSTSGALDRLQPATLLRLDAALCAAHGLPAVVAAPALADVLGPDVPAPAVLAVGVALVGYALGLLLLSRSHLVTSATRVAGIGSLAWEVALLALVVLGAFSVGGAAVAVVSALTTGLLGVVQLRSVRRR
jgi:hypothetical protein